MKLGASDYLAKPINCGTLEEVISRHSRRLLNKKHGFDEIIGVSVPMQEVFGLIKRAAASESNVLITGESGTGKELISRAIHRWSPRSDREFMSINCSAIPDTLLESELSGLRARSPAQPPEGLGGARQDGAVRRDRREHRRCFR
jgi:DNA-binding NtrC family response regulator